MTVGDVPAVYDIEQQSFPSGSWTMDAFYHELEKNEFGHYFVMTLDDQVIGYLGLWIVIDQAQITTVAIAETLRGCGYGQLLLEYVMNYARMTCEMMSLEVREENAAARHVYEKLGFSYGGLRRDYYGPGQDAKVMWVRLKNE
ncbi:ribosomal protein S18-alanine N-acetyltransferase [Macrococcus equipercicus]|uniref:[Ribosomal protein bS18]-alanine N-acetyltransferase n=1 Tax=Macrococcus equipercicus TaxID=69967 RepID=A0A9Q9F2D3_9STAP|nr:ribosomal protein S18-alanine N-acetyltransferase [Macrococcus equipercicus]KAA1036610.1 ribosomal-protein-alanine N-acetyltransferase [Macrococcus equipercicus]UTH14922.1 ribosomal protein S18-alanine N-acetyltransferase [Macrococcus equipercicus]